MWGVYSLLWDTVYIVYVHLFKNLIILPYFTVFDQINEIMVSRIDFFPQKNLFQTIAHVYKLLLLHCTVFILFFYTV